MHVVINISEDYYKIVKHDVESGNDFLPYKLIANGTPLPKDHGRLIDADTLVDGFEDNYEFCEAVNATPTIIEADKE